MSDLPPQQALVFAFVRDYLARHGYPPTRREISAALGSGNPNACDAHLKALRQKGLIDWTPKVARSVVMAGGAGWTESLPTESGFYWWRGGRGGRGRVVDVIVTERGGTVEFCGSEVVEKLAEIGGQWHGPLAPPGGGG